MKKLIAGTVRKVKFFTDERCYLLISCHGLKNFSIHLKFDSLLYCLERFFMILSSVSGPSSGTLQPKFCLLLGEIYVLYIFIGHKALEFK